MAFRLRLSKIAAAFLLALLPVSAEAALAVGEWRPVFKGVELSISTNIPGPGSEIARLQVVYAVRVDLTDPDVSFFTTPQIATNYIRGVREVGAYTCSDFLARNDLQVVINANFFDNGTYYLPAGTPMNLYGLEVSQGTEVSAADSAQHAAVIAFSATNQPTFVRSNRPAISIEGIYTAVSGNFPILVGGTNIGTKFEVDPRTLFGLSGDRRYLFLVAIDGRQSGYSSGATLYECGQWLLALGATDGINLDGGGSTTLVFEDHLGDPMRINKSSAVADSGRERTVGSHFGIFAKSLPGFINDVTVEPDDTSAIIRFTTITPTTSRILYGLSTNLDLTTGQSTTEVTNHTWQITGLTPETPYYFRVSALSNDVEQLTPTRRFFTTNYTQTNLVFDVTNVWRYFFTSLDEVKWTENSYDDGAWGFGPGLLWVDGNPNPEVEPRNTEMPGTVDGYARTTYYFRTHVELGALKPGSSLLFRGFIDDGAVFYLNGSAIYRIRMSAAASYATLANGVPCYPIGDAVCIDEFKLPLTVLPSLIEGDNVIAVEVHNYNTRSDDVTFGLALHLIEPIERMNPIELSISQLGNDLVIQWDGTGGTVQSAALADGPWNDLENTVSDRVTIQISGEQQYFRLVR